MTNNDLLINSDRLWKSLEEMALIGPGIAGGNNRQTLTDADALGRLHFKQNCEQAGCTVSCDQMGNQFACRTGTDPEALPVYIGSHLDTQPTGGKYDGVLGVLAGLEVVRRLNDLHIQTERSIVVTNWTNEEGSRFAPPMLASGVFAGMHSLGWAYERVDAEGKKFGDELRRIAAVGEEAVGERQMHAYYELHIEQGPILEKEGKEIGVVTHGQGLRWLEICLTGRESHAGSTPMPMRRNAMLGLAQIAIMADKVAWDHAPHGLTTIGQADVYPNSRNSIAGRVTFTVDFRHPEQSILEAMEELIREGAANIAEDLGLELEIREVGEFDPVQFNEHCVNTVREAARRLGYSYRDIVSGAGHDACWINRVAPTAMIMCPCVDGLSHNEAEKIFPEWAAAGANVLFHAVIESAGVSENSSSQE